MPAPATETRIEVLGKFAPHFSDTRHSEKQELQIAVRIVGWVRKRFSPVSVQIDQVVVFAAARFTPAKGFSCSRQARPCR